MSDKVALATAWVRLAPSFDGVTESLVKEFEPGAKAAGDEGDKAGKGWASRVKKAITAAAITAGVVAAFKGLYEVGRIFDDVTDTIRIGSGAQGEALEDLVGTAKTVATSIPTSFDAAANAVADVNTRFGLTGDLLETVASQYLEAGRMLGQELDIGKTSAAFNAFRIEGDGVSEALDHLFRVSQSTGIGVNELAASVQSNAPAVQALGFSFEDTASLIGVMDKAGLNSTQVMSSMSRSLVNLAKDGEQPQEAFNRVVDELQGFIASGDQAAAIDLAGKVFGTRGASQFVAALESGAIGIDDLAGAAGIGGDTILGLSEETMDFGEQWQKTMNLGLVAIEPFATAVFKGLGGALEAIMPFLQDLGSWIGENTGVIGIIAGVIGGTLVAAFVAWTASIWASTVAMLANPITWIVIAVLALIAAVVALVMNWDEVVAWITEIWDGFVTWIIEVIEGFVEWWNGIWEAVGEFISDTWEGFIGWITDIWQGFVDWLFGIGDGIAAWWTGLWSGIGSFFSSIWEGISSFASGIFNGIKGFFESVFGGIGDWWSGLWDGIGTTFENVWNGIMSFFKDIANGVLGAVEGFVNTFIDMINGITGGINDITGFIGIPAIPAIPKLNIPRLAEGATVLPRRGGTLAILAEAGKPESVVDTGLMNRALEEGLSGGAGGLRAGDRLSLVVGGREFDAYVEQLAGDRVQRSIGPASRRALQSTLGS